MTKSKKKTLRDYILFLRKHGFAQEAFYYSTEVVKVLGQFYSLSNEEVLNLGVDEIIPRLEDIKTNMEKTFVELSKDHNPSSYDIEIHRKE